MLRFWSQWRRTTGAHLPGRRDRWRLIGLAGAGGGLLVFSLAVVLTDRAAEMAQARARVVGHLAAITETLGATRRGFDLALERIAQEVDGRTLADLRDDRVVHQLMVDVKNRLPNAESVFVVDADGRTVTSSRAFPMPPYDVRERDYFRAARAGQTGSYVSLPFRGQMSRTTSFVVSRAVLHEGQLAGLVAITVFPMALTSSYQAMLGEADMVLARRDGAVLIRTDGARAVERLPEQGEVMRLVGAGDGGVFSGASFIDGGRALQGVHVVPDGDLVVAVALREDDIFSGWQRRTFMMGGGAALAFAGLLAFVLARERGGRAWWPGAHGPRPGRNGQAAFAGAGGGARATGADLAGAAVPVLQFLTSALASPARTDAAAARLRDLVGLLRQVSGPRTPMAVAPAVDAARALLAGAGGPNVVLQPGDADLWVMADRGRFELALLDLAVGLSALAPAGVPLGIALVVRGLDARTVHDLPAGTYVRVRVEAVAVEAHDTGAPAGRFALAAACAEAMGGACVPPLPDGPLRAELWLLHVPAARADA